MILGAGLVFFGTCKVRGGGGGEVEGGGDGPGCHCWGWSGLERGLAEEGVGGF